MQSTAGYLVHLKIEQAEKKGMVWRDLGVQHGWTAERLVGADLQQAGHEPVSPLGFIGVGTLKGWQR